jgi:glycosyltransferase involved in cell wall biosynthesis
MQFHYISPSTLPSRSANSVHVAWQCDALCRLGIDVTLYAKRTVEEASDLPAALNEAYGIDTTGLRLQTVHNPSGRGDNLAIAYKAIRHLRGIDRDAAILSRNLYAAFVLAVLYRRPILFETHQLETGLRKWLQKRVVLCPWVITIVISDHLARYLTEHLGFPPRRMLVLHDAAPDGIEPVPVDQRRAQLCRLAEPANGPWRQVCGYFGHLYPGRGIEIVEAMAAAVPDALFLVYGGTEQDLETRRRSNDLPNLVFMGHVSHPIARRLMTMMDVLLMPYQENVSIGVSGHDTARWMSPMKMFEYLGTGVPIISSDLPVLREVLREGENCLLAPASDSSAWISALHRLRADQRLAARLGINAHEEYKAAHTWTARARNILAAIRRSS